MGGERPAYVKIKVRGVELKPGPLACKVLVMAAVKVMFGSIGEEEIGTTTDVIHVDSESGVGVLRMPAANVERVCSSLVSYSCHNSIPCAIHILDKALSLGGFA